MAEIKKGHELIIGLVGPIGVDLELVISALESELRNVNYTPYIIKITDIMTRINIGLDITDETYADKYHSLIKYADKIRECAENDCALASLAITEIRNIRARENVQLSAKDLKGRSVSDLPLNKTAYIIRQFKRSEEIDLLRKTYGRKFIQISVYMSKTKRIALLKKKIKEFLPGRINDSDCENQAKELVDIDYNEKMELHGQRISDVFHMGDVFVEGENAQQVDESIKNFVKAFFGWSKISPTRMEYGMYSAAAASLRSLDLSRQVGAAIFTKDGEKLCSGCNEVPKAFGGTYWQDEAPNTHRDIEDGGDKNYLRKVEIIFDFLKRLAKVNALSDKSIVILKSREELDNFLSHEEIEKSQVMDILEFSRVIHAEMCAICDAARLGISLKGAILYCTTFPCHMCAKHIVASGIKKVVFLEPYPKSYAEDLHQDSITFSAEEAGNKVLFEPFIGISPRRYRDIFEKGKRKDRSGKPVDWYEGSPTPRVEDRGASYIENEEPNVSIGLQKILDLLEGEPPL